jgi:hypothetical protein
VLPFCYLYLANHDKLNKSSTFRESDINFIFDDSWLVYRFDQHRYYRGFSGAGLKGVDFLALRNDDQLVLMEIKNYNPRGPWKRGNTLTEIIAEPDILVQHFTAKIKDTLLAVDAIRQYWQRRWWRRILWKIFSHLHPRYHEYAFWQRVCTHVRHPEQCVAVLWLESTDIDQALREKLRQRLSEKLRDYCSSVMVCDYRHQPFGHSLQVFP